MEGKVPGAEEVVQLNEVEELKGEYQGNVQEEWTNLQDELRVLSKEGKLEVETDKKGGKYFAIGVRMPKKIQNGKYIAFYYDPVNPQVVQKDYICGNSNTRRVVPKTDVHHNIRYLSWCRPSSRGRAARLLIKYIP